MGSDFVFGVGSAVVAEEGSGTFLADDEGEAEEDEHEEAGNHEGDPDVVEVQHPLSETETKKIYIITIYRPNLTYPNLT